MLFEPIQVADISLPGVSSKVIATAVQQQNQINSNLKSRMLTGMKQSGKNLYRKNGLLNSDWSDFSNKILSSSNLSDEVKQVLIAESADDDVKMSDQDQIVRDTIVELAYAEHPIKNEHPLVTADEMRQHCQFHFLDESTDGEWLINRSPMRVLHISSRLTGHDNGQLLQCFDVVELHFATPQQLSTIYSNAQLASEISLEEFRRQIDSRYTQYKDMQTRTKDVENLSTLMATSKDDKALTDDDPSWFSYFQRIYSKFSLSQLLDELYVNYQALPNMLQFMIDIRRSICLYLGTTLVNFTSLRDNEAMVQVILRMHALQIVKNIAKISLDTIHFLIVWFRRLAQVLFRVPFLGVLAQLTDQLLEFIQSQLKTDTHLQSIVKWSSPLIAGLLCPTIAPQLQKTVGLFLQGYFTTQVSGLSAAQFTSVFEFDLANAADYAVVLNNYRSTICKTLIGKKELCENALYYLSLLLGSTAMIGLVWSMMASANIFVALYTGKKIIASTATQYSCLGGLVV